MTTITPKQLAAWRKRLDIAERTIENVAREVDAERPRGETTIGDIIGGLAGELHDSADSLMFARRWLDRLEARTAGVTAA